MVNDTSSQEENVVESPQEESYGNDIEESGESRNTLRDIRDASRAVKSEKRAKSDENNTQAVRVAADVVSKVGGVPGAIAQGVKTADRISGGAATRDLGKQTTILLKLSGRGGRKTQKNINRAAKYGNSRIGNRIMDYAMNKGKGGSNSNSADNKFADGSHKSTEANKASDSGSSDSKVDAKGTIKKRLPIPTSAIIAIVIIVIIFLILFVIISAISGGYSKKSSSSAGNGSVNIYSVNGTGQYFLSNEDNDYFNSNIVYIDENNVSTTYALNDFLAGAIYAMTDDGLNGEIYKVYAVLLRSNILTDSDGVIDYNDYMYLDPSSIYSNTIIRESIEDTKYELLLDGSNSIIKTDFSNNNCDNCSLEDGISFNVVKILVDEQNYDHKQVIEELFADYYVTTVSFSTVGDISLELKNTVGAEYLNVPITQFLSSHGSSLEDLNHYISSNVEPVYGTGEGVATAAVALINYLYDGFGTKLPYYWGGKYEHVGANPSFGVYRPTSRANGQLYNYISLDCSGLAQWAIINGGIKNPGTGTVYFAQVFRNRCDITYSNCVGEIGDLINYRTRDNSRGHVQIIVSVDVQNNMYYIAESSTYGVVVTTREMHKGRDDATVYVLHMADYYRNNVRREG